MIRVDLTADDCLKLRRAYDDLTTLLDLIEKRDRERGDDRKPNGFITDAHRCLKEVLFGR